MSERSLSAGLIVLAVAVLFGSQQGFAGTNAVFQKTSDFKTSESAKDELMRVPDGEFTEIKTVSALPDGVRTGMAELFKQHPLAVGDPGQPFNATDVVKDSYPFRRLIFAGCTKEKCVVHYERGGRGLSYYAIVFRLDKGPKATVLWSGVYRAPAHDLKQLRSQPHSEAGESSSH